MRKIRQMGKCLIATLFLALTAAMFLPHPVTHAADGTTNVKITGTYKQSEARSMLNMVNDFRTGKDAWYWNQDDTTKTTCSNLKTLTYDYELEKIAMQRAAEIAVSFSHTRPNGEDCFSLTSNGTSSYGENIAYHSYNSPAARDTYMLWREDKEDYSGQGHRRNMLGSYYTAIGIGCFEYNGRYYWVQEFGFTSSNSSATAAKNQQTPVNVEVVNDYIKINNHTDIKLSSDSYTYNGTARKPSVTVTNIVPDPKYSYMYSKIPLTEGTHYTVSYKNNTDAGTATVTVTGIGEDNGSKSVTFKIDKINNSIKAKNLTKTSAGKAQTFSIGASAKDNAKLTYKSSNKNVKIQNGKVTISKNYVGKSTITITAAATKNYKQVTKKITVTVMPKGTALKKVKSLSGKKMSVSWKRNSSASGYQIQYSTDKNFKSGNKSISVNKNKTTSRTITKLKAKKKYYVRIRTYKKAGGTKVYSEWSKVKTVVSKAK